MINENFTVTQSYQFLAKHTFSKIIFKFFFSFEQLALFTFVTLG